MNNYYWNKRNVSLDKDEIAPWKLPRNKHATISVLLHRENELQTVDDYLATCEELYDVDYKKRLNGSTTEAWNETLNRLHARYNKRKNNKVLECLQFGGNKEFWDGFQSKNEILGQNVVLRKIPFTPAAKKVIPYIDFEKAKNANLNTVATRMKRLFSNHHPHELRHTFITRCKECGVQSEVVSIWAGHSLSGTITTTVYTHYSDEFQLKEAEKVNYR